MAAVRAGDPVVVGEVRHHARRHGFLAHVEMQRTRDLAVFGELAGLLFEGPDAHHAAVHVEQDVVARLYGHVGVSSQCAVIVRDACGDG